MLSLNKVSVHFGSFELLKEISFMVNPRDKIGLTGKNGAGKSTLLKIMKGIESPSGGDISVPGDIKIGYLPQHIKTSNTQSVLAETKTAFKEVNELNTQIQHLTTEIQNRTDYESDEYHNLANKLAHATEHIAVLGADSIEALTEQTLKGLGFVQEDFGRPTAEFSGGWRMRIEIAKLLLQKPDVFLLDEPTNHLDIESIQWFEGFLKNYPGAIVLVSHDRAFLDAITNRTIEISLGKIYDYKYPYSQYLEQKEIRMQQQKAAYENQQKLITETERFIDRFRYKATKAVQVQSRIKQLEKLERIELEESDKREMNVNFPPAPRSGTIVVEGKSVSKHYGDHCVLSDVDITIERGEKIALVGKNGEGKTTLIRIIMQDLDFDGLCKQGINVKTGYFAQNQVNSLDQDKSVFETIDDVATGDIRTKIRDILGAFLFSGEDVDKKVSVLSGGEKTRLALAKLLLEPYNLLVLDEPTNHLDMVSKEVLKKALLKYDGTLILVSHDRDFLNGLIDKIYEVKNTHIKEFTGGIFQFLKQKNIESLQEFNTNKNMQQAEEKPATNSANKEKFLLRKEYEKKLRKIKNEVDNAEQAIEEIENKIAHFEELMSNNTTGDTLDYNDYESLKKKLSEQMEIWENRTLDFEQLQSERDAI